MIVGLLLSRVAVKEPKRTKLPALLLETELELELDAELEVELTEHDGRPVETRGPLWPSRGAPCCSGVRGVLDWGVRSPPAER